MARSQNEMLRDLLAVVRDHKLHTGDAEAVVAEVTAYLAEPPAPPAKPPKPQASARSAPVVVTVPPLPEPKTEQAPKIEIKKEGA